MAGLAVAGEWIILPVVNIKIVRILIPVILVALAGVAGCPALRWYGMSDLKGQRTNLVGSAGVQSDKGFTVLSETTDDSRGGVPDLLSGRVQPEGGAWILCAGPALNSLEAPVPLI